MLTIFKILVQSDGPNCHTSGEVERLEARIQALSSELQHLKTTSEAEISRLTEERDAARAAHERLTSRFHTHTHLSLIHI